VVGNKRQGNLEQQFNTMFEGEAQLEEQTVLDYGRNNDHIRKADNHEQEHRVEDIAGRRPTRLNALSHFNHLVDRHPPH